MLNPNAVAEILKGETRNVWHIHGYWDEPEGSGGGVAPGCGFVGAAAALIGTGKRRYGKPRRKGEAAKGLYAYGGRGADDSPGR